MRHTEELIHRIVISSHVTSGKRRQEIERELRAHFEDFIIAQSESDGGRGDFEEHVLANFGDPDQIATCFAWVYRHERRWLRTFVFMLSTALLTFFLLVAVLATQTGVAFGFGIPIAHVIASKHTSIEALDIFASVAAYLGLTVLESIFQTAKFQKASALLALIVVAVSAVCIMGGLHTGFLAFGVVNGMFTRAIQLFVTRTSVRFIIVTFCFPLAGLLLALEWSSVRHIAIAATCGSWVVAGTGYQLMAHLAARVDRTLLSCIERIY